MPFSIYPAGNLVPGVYHELNTVRANTAVNFNVRTLLIGQMMAGGTAVANLPLLVSSGDYNTLFGAKSQLAAMVQTYRQRDTFGEIWALPLADDGGAVAATAPITVTGNATSAASMALYTGGNRYPFNVASGDTPAVALTKLLVAMCNKPRAVEVKIGTKVLTLSDPANPGLCTDATTSPITSPISIVACNLGAAGNAMGLALNHRGQPAGETMPAGQTWSAGTPTGGATNPVLTTGLANLADQKFGVIALPYQDSVSLDAMKAFLNDTTGRWAWSKAIFGHCVTAFPGTTSAAATFAAGRNDQHLSAVSYVGSPDPVWEWTAAFAAAVAESTRADPALPVTSTYLNVETPAMSNRATISEMNTLLYAGISTWRAGDDNAASLDRVVTTYTKTNGADDTSYRDYETPATIDYILTDMRSKLATRFKRCKLVSDNSILPGSATNVATPRDVKAYVVSLYRGYQDNLQIVQNADAFAKAVQVFDRGSGRIDIIVPADLSNQLRTMAIEFQFAKP